MSRVFAAEERALGRKVVVKVLPPEVAGAVSVERFRREINLAAALHHPHIVPLLSAGEAGGVLYYTTPFVVGESLRSRLEREGELPVPEAVRILRDVASALSYAHQQGTVHRDIKPDNVLLSGRYALVTDFGVARALGTSARAGRLTATGVAVGTPAYMAPEQVAADAQADHRVDVYAFGCLAYELLAGRPPFQAASVQALLTAQIAHDPQPLRALRPSVPPPLEQLVMRCLAKRPADRPQTAEEIVRALDTIVAEIELVSGGDDRLRRARWRRGAIVAGAAVAVLSLIAAGMFMTLPAGRRATVRTLLTRARPKLNPRRVVVAPFENRTGDTALAAVGEMAADWIAGALARTAEVEVVDPRTALLASMLVRETPRILRPADRALALAEETGAGTVVSGSYYRHGDDLSFQVNISDAVSRKLLRPVDPVSGRADALADVVGALGRRTVAAVTAVLDAPATGYTAAVGQPPSYEAYREVSRGWNAVFRGDTAEFFARTTRAATLDTSFVLPIIMQASVRAAFRQWPQVDSLERRLQARRARLAPAEVAGLEFLQAGLRGDLLGRLRAAQEFMRLTGSPEGAVNVALAAVDANRPREALQALARTDPRRGVLLVHPMYWIARTAALHQLGEHRTELQDAKTAVRQFPDDVDAARVLIRALAALGRVDDLATQLERGSAIAKNRSLYSRYLPLIAVRELRAHGHGAAAGRFLAEALRTADADTSVRVRRVHSALLYEAGRWAEARTLFARLAAADSNDVGVLGYLGAIAARLGERAEAARVDATLAALRRPYLFGEHTAWRAHIAAVRGDADSAITLLRAAADQGYQIVFSPSVADPHAHLDFAALRDHADFRRLLAPR
jgi:tetratricopeptide (TPR) repeat protein/TolB-like protein